MGQHRQLVLEAELEEGGLDAGGHHLGIDLEEEGGATVVAGNRALLNASQQHLVPEVLGAEPEGQLGSSPLGDRRLAAPGCCSLA